MNESYSRYFERRNAISGHCHLMSFLLSNMVLPLLHLPPTLLSHRLNASSCPHRLSAFSFRMLEAEDDDYSLPPVLHSTPSFSSSPCSTFIFLNFLFLLLHPFFHQSQHSCTHVRTRTHEDESQPHFADKWRCWSKRSPPSLVPIQDHIDSTYFNILSTKKIICLASFLGLFWCMSLYDLFCI